MPRPGATPEVVITVAKLLDGIRHLLFVSQIVSSEMTTNLLKCLQKIFI